MERKLTDFYPWNFSTAPSSSGDLSREFILCIDRNTNGNEFAFDLMLCSLLIANNSVILLAANHTKSHYEYILNKNNISIAKLSQLLHFIPLTIPLNEYVDISANINTLSTQWNGIMNSIHDKIKSNPNIQYTVMMDDLTCMELYSQPSMWNSKILSGVYNTRVFVNCIYNMLVQGKINNVICYSKAYLEPVVSLNKVYNHNTVISNPSEGIQEEEVPCYLACSYKSTMNIIIAALNTGYSMDIHGQIQVICNHQHTPSISLTYKALDSGVYVGVL